jgi:hypothetical protein
MAAGLCVAFACACDVDSWSVAASQDVPRGALQYDRPIPYFIAPGTPASGFRSGDAQLAQWALEAWQRTVGSALRLVAAPESDALVRIYWAGPLDGQYGEMRPLTVGDRRGASVYIRPDVAVLDLNTGMRARSDSLLRDGIVYLTCLHELGHAFGLEHTEDFRDIMYFFGYGGDIVEYFDRYRRQLRTRDDIATTSGLSAGDIARIRTLYAQ